MPEKYTQLQDWLRFQVVWLYVCLGISLLIGVCFRYMQSKHIRKADEDAEEENQKKAA